MTLLGRVLRFYDHPIISLVWLLAPAHRYGPCSLIVGKQDKATILHVLATTSKSKYVPRREMSRIASYLAERSFHSGILMNKDFLGLTALDYAILARNIDIAKALISVSPDTSDALMALSAAEKDYLAHAGARLSDPFFDEVRVAIEQRKAILDESMRSLRELSRH